MLTLGYAARRVADSLVAPTETNFKAEEAVEALSGLLQLLGYQLTSIPIPPYQRSKEEVARTVVCLLNILARVSRTKAKPNHCL